MYNIERERIAVKMAGRNIVDKEKKKKRRYK